LAVVYSVVALNAAEKDAHTSDPAKIQSIQSIKAMLPDQSSQSGATLPHVSSEAASQIPIIVAVSATAQPASGKKIHPKDS
jgi:hypothetical protein